MYQIGFHLKIFFIGHFNGQHPMYSTNINVETVTLGLWFSCCKNTRNTKVLANIEIVIF